MENSQPLIEHLMVHQRLDIRPNLLGQVIPIEVPLLCYYRPLTEAKMRPHQRLIL